MVGFQNGYPSDSSLEKRGVNLLLDKSTSLRYELP